MNAAERSVAIYLVWSFFLLTLFPESDQSIGRLALTHMENPTALEVNDNGLVHALFGQQTRLCRYCPLSQERAATLKSVNLFDRVPRHAQKMGCVFEGGIPFKRSTTYLVNRRV